VGSQRDECPFNLQALERFPCRNYSLSISGIRDQAGNMIAAPERAQIIRGWILEIDHSAPRAGHLIAKHTCAPNCQPLAILLNATSQSQSGTADGENRSGQSPEIVMVMLLVYPCDVNTCPDLGK
jgi:hypothetical protein